MPPDPADVKPVQHRDADGDGGPRRGGVQEGLAAGTVEVRGHGGPGAASGPPAQRHQRRSSAPNVLIPNNSFQGNKIHIYLESSSKYFE